ncbi:hypothetical protein QGM71_19595 [Virgibacillus sp. C22-A2]|uniref:Uncharacterized protein n=1 Tax=Virgibacillus tibetensis TaxID=3042313 RepID=A0ABU6KK30_9BACI|nr:hypothetical protein [Virgibacillus sp. C22-A2]
MNGSMWKIIFVQENFIGRILSYIGVIIIISGLIAGYNMSTYVHYVDGYGNEERFFEWTSFFVLAGGSFLFGVALLGFSEVINLLHIISGRINSLKLTNENKKPSIYEENHEIEDMVKSKEWTLQESDEQKIYQLFSDKAILEIKPTEVEENCIVRLQDREGPLSPYVTVVDVSGMMASEVQDVELKQHLIAWYNEQT